MSEHTKGRLSVEYQGFEYGYDLDTEDRATLAEGLSEANARRLAAAWNVCAGFETESLENILMLGDTMRSRFATLKDECDQAHKELNAARALLREVVETADMFKRGMENLGAVTGPNEQIERIRSYLDACDTLEGAPNAG